MKSSWRRWVKLIRLGLEESVIGITTLHMKDDQNLI